MKFGSVVDATPTHSEYVRPSTIVSPAWPLPTWQPVTAQRGVSTISWMQDSSGSNGKFGSSLQLRAVGVESTMPSPAHPTVAREARTTSTTGTTRTIREEDKVAPERKGICGLTSRMAKAAIGVVGAARFERATPCSQSRCATRLRHAPARATLPHALLARPSASSESTPLVTNRCDMIGNRWRRRRDRSAVIENVFQLALRYFSNARAVSRLTR